ncbi:MAG: alcohol dehydrogenase catalytic domain-containing protein [Armatimonadota bacterium]|nr:alcohol dehydrogenase catalytic domain-containing protein [bacterium]
MHVASAYVQKPFQVSFQDVELRPPSLGEVLIDVLGCGICGYDMEMAEYLADKPQAFGHEIVGIVREVGEGVTHVAPGDQVVLESGSFCCDCADCRNGRVDLCAKGRNFWGESALGFSEAMIAPARAVVPAPDIDPMAAVLAEPCGVAIDMVVTAEIGLTDRVLVVGTGAIGLMALAIARHKTTGPVVAANRTPGRLEAAKRVGVDAVVALRETPLKKCGEPYGGFDKILITAPPQVIPDCITAAAYGAYIVYIGSDFGGGGVVPIDTHALHFGKKQLRSSFASPALYLPQALHMLRTSAVPAKEIVSHVFPLSKISEALRTVREERDTARKVVVVPDARFESEGSR